MRARGGTRTAFQPLQTLGTRGNMRNPARTDPSTTQSEATSVDTVNAAHLPDFLHLQAAAALPDRGRGSSVFCARSLPAAPFSQLVSPDQFAPQTRTRIPSCGYPSLQTSHGLKQGNLHDPTPRIQTVKRRWQLRGVKKSQQRPLRHPTQHQAPRRLR